MSLLTSTSRLVRSSAIPLIAVGMGAVGILGVQKHIDQEVDRRLPEPVQTIDIVVANQTLDAGLRVGQGEFAIRAVPIEYVPQGAVSAHEFDGLADLKLTAPLGRGDPLVRSNLRLEARQESFASTLQPGRRAITVPVDELNSSAGLMQAGDRIDLYVSFTQSNRRTVAPVLLGVQVLATGARVEEFGAASADPNDPSAYANSYHTVTLDVAPEEAVRIHAARQAGQLLALLRPEGDLSTPAAGARGALSYLLELDEPPRPPPPRIPVLVGGGSQSLPNQLRVPAQNPSTVAAPRWSAPSALPAEQVAEGSPSIQQEQP